MAQKYPPGTIIINNIVYNKSRKRRKQDVKTLFPDQQMAIARLRPDRFPVTFLFLFLYLQLFILCKRIILLLDMAEPVAFFG